MGQGEDGEAPGWRWDPTLYAGSAEHYSLGRVPYPAAVAEVLVGALQPDGSHRLLDVGCGPGSLTLLLAPYFAESIGVDADADMLAEAARIADERQIRTVRWQHLRAEELPAGLPRFDVVTFAQSFHWMDRPMVAAAVRRMLSPGGVVVHVGARTHEGVEDDAPHTHPRPPWAAVDRLVRQYLGPVRRAGQGVLAAGTAGGEDEIFRAAGFVGPERLGVPAWDVRRTGEQILASVHSLSSAAPHLFGDRLEAFDEHLRDLLAASSTHGLFSERMPEITLSIWR